MNSSMRRARRRWWWWWWCAAVGGLMVLAGMVVVTQMAGAGPAAALTGLVRATNISATNSTSPKTVEAVCPSGTRVIGGGGWVFATALADETKVMLTQVEPVTNVNGDRYTVTGTEIAAGISGTWWVQAYAMCAAAPSGYVIVSNATVSSSLSPQLIRAVCPSGKKAFGSGGRIDGSAGEVSFVVEHTLGITQAEVVAREDANGFAGGWRITAFAVCADPRINFSVAGAQTARNSQDTKSVTVTCPLGTKVHNAGADIRGAQLHTSSAPDGVAIQQLYPNGNLNKVDVFAVELVPITADWDLRAEAVCGP